MRQSTRYTKEFRISIWKTIPNILRQGVQTVSYCAAYWKEGQILIKVTLFM